MEPECCAPDACTPAAAVDLRADERDDELARLAKAIAHPARIRILRLLAAKGTCIGGEIVNELDLAQSTVSEHLRILREAGFVQGEIERPRVCYCLAPDVLHRFKFLVGSL
ncbi:MAG TPA: metalloregulator ArsR/SmtB family transcription factor [Azospirillum sp.]